MVVGGMSMVGVHTTNIIVGCLETCAQTTVGVSVLDRGGSKVYRCYMLTPSMMVILQPHPHRLCNQDCSLESVIASRIHGGYTVPFKLVFITGRGGREIMAVMVNV
jgi:hypothetical protein